MAPEKKQSTFIALIYFIIFMGAVSAVALLLFQQFQSSRELIVFAWLIMGMLGSGYVRHINSKNKRERRLAATEKMIPDGLFSDQTRLVILFDGFTDNIELKLEQFDFDECGYVIRVNEQWFYKLYDVQRNFILKWHCYYASYKHAGDNHELAMFKADKAALDDTIQTGTTRIRLYEFVYGEMLRLTCGKNFTSERSHQLSSIFYNSTRKEFG